LCDFFFFTRIWFSPYGIYKFVRESLFLQRPYSFIRGMLLCTTSGAGRCGHRPLRREVPEKLLRCAQHRFLPKTGPFCRLRRHFPRARGNYLKEKALRPPWICA